MRRVIDNSVVFKWFAEETDSDRAKKYLEDFVAGKDKILIPTLLFYEFGQACRNGALPSQAISRIMELMQKLPFQIEDVGFTSFRKIYQIASEYDLSFYDASYVTLMQKHDCELVTADKKLYNKLKTKLKRTTLLQAV
ncbi:TPA: hypothetical protein DIV55_03915 [Patescibacteria group bacterium]|uniref:PIN domain-containing protein n=1 Tax=Candidatus Gottesmanbacteria bacterium GW2011_GWA1_43_11 TaxID=1618436 RepID=A0A0G1FB86_9BACT|nr:MAG: hypothetical protein UV59_C0027G0016 [Candidatus Gottesmanbacteria bacterium GW2011_GWA1_43_11]HCS78866.1 hypothetical protein [Patescibacteria group bacterium]